MMHSAQQVRAAAAQAVLGCGATVSLVRNAAGRWVLNPNDPTAELLEAVEDYILNGLDDDLREDAGNG